MSIAKKSFIDFSAQVIVFFLSFISGIILSRLLGPEGRGIFVTTLFVNTLLHNLSCFAIEITNVYVSGKDNKKIPEIHTWSVIIISVITILLFTVVFIFEGFFREKVFGGLQRDYLWIGVMIVPFTLYYAAWKGILIGLGEIKKLSIVSILYQYMQAIFIISFLILIKNPLPYLIGSWAIIQILLIFFLLIILYKIIGKNIFGKPDKNILKSILEFGFVAHIGNFATTLVNRLDWIYLNSFLGTTGIGIYSQATTFTDKIAFLPQAIERAGYSRVCSSETPEAQKLTVKIFRNTLWVASLSIVAMYIFGTCIIYFILPKFQDAIYPLRVLLLGTLFYALSRIFSMYFSGHKGKPKIPTMIAWFLVFFNAAVNYFLIKNYLLAGAAIGTTISFMMMFLINFHIFIKEVPEIKFSYFFILQKEDYPIYKNLINELYKRILTKRKN